MTMGLTTSHVSALGTLEFIGTILPNKGRDWDDMMIKRARESNKPGARDVCGARGETQGLHFIQRVFQQLL